MNLIEAVQKKYKFSKNKAKNYIINNRVTVNNIVINKTKFTVVIDQVDIFYPKVFTKIWENENIIIVYKHHNFSVSRFFNTPLYEPVVNEEVLKITNLCSTKYVNEFGLIHRLDKETSGLLILCKNSFVLSKILYFNHNITKAYNSYYDNTHQESLKFYVFICKHNQLIVTNQYDCDCENNNYTIKLLKINKMQQVNNDGTNTLTLCNKQFNRFRCKLNSGKKHQIRILMKHIGFPITGDSIYNNHKSKHKMLLFANYLSIPIHLIYQ